MTDPRPGTPGSENTPAGDGPPSVEDRVAPGSPPPGSNQAKDESFQPAADVTGDAGTVGSADPQGGNIDVPGSAHRQRDSAGDAPAGALADDDALGAARTTPGTPPGAPMTVPSPGDSSGVAVPSVHTARGTSEESEAVTGVRATAIARPGKPDGEVDTSR